MELHCNCRQEEDFFLHSVSLNYCWATSLSMPCQRELNIRMTHQRPLLLFHLDSGYRDLAVS